MFDWPELPFARAAPWRRGVALALGALAVGLDLTVFRTPTLGQSWWRTVMGLAVLAAFVILGGGVQSLGMRGRPLPDGRFWRRAMLCVSAAAGGLLALAVVTASLRDTWVLPPVENARELWHHVVGSCVHAPVTEELLYRVAICAPLAVLVGPRATIVVSGIAFGLLHALWGTFEWTHPLAGVLLGWVYLRSSSVWLVIAIHAFFNIWGLAVLSIQWWLGAS
jgi:membrane protease YdiL (CAAX protease family)